eukprot:gene2818-5540_t
MGDTEAKFDDYDFEGGDAGASFSVPCEAGQIRVGKYMIMNDRPVKISAVSTSKTGKHGSAKCNFAGYDIFNGKKIEDMQPSSNTVQVPNVIRKEYTLLDISPDDYCSLMDENGNTREDLKLPDYPDNFNREIRKAFEDGKSLMISVLGACGIEQIVAMKDEADAKA